MLTVLLAGGAALAFEAAPVGAAPGQTRYVATNGDNGTTTPNTCLMKSAPCASIGYAVSLASNGDTILVGPGQFNDEEVVVYKSVTISGSTTGTTTVTGGDDPVFTFSTSDSAPDAHSTLRNVSVSGDMVVSAVDVEGGDVTIQDSVLTHTRDGGVDVKGGSAHVEDSVIKQGDYGVRVVTGNALIEGSTISHNSGIGVDVDGGDPPSATISRSTISDNQQGGVRADNGATVNVTESTLSGNTGFGVLAGNGGGNDVAVATVVDSTITATVESSQPGLASAGLNPQFAGASPGVVRVSGTIVADNSPVPDCGGAPIDRGYNLSSDTSCGFSAGKHDVVGANPELGALADNGGRTETQLPATGSPARDAVPSGAAGCDAGATDQRGESRPQPAGGRCDIGSVEVAVAPVVIHPASLPDGTVGRGYRQQLTATGGTSRDYVFSVASGSSAPPGLGLSSDGLLRGQPTTAGTFSFTVSVNGSTTKRYSVTIDPAAATSASTTPTPTSPAPTTAHAPTSAASSAALARTGVPSNSLASLGGGAIIVGIVLVLATRIGRRDAKPRRAR